MSECIFCKIIQKEIPSRAVYEDEQTMVISDLHPQAPIHYLVIPKVHHAEFLDMPDALLTQIFATAKQVISSERIKDYRLVNNGQGAALIPHFHLHILGKVDKTRML